MNSRIIISTFVLLISGAVTLIAQNTGKQATPVDPSQNAKAFIAGAQDDLRLSPEQQEQMRKAGDDNPSGPEQGVLDNKLSGKDIPDEKYYGEKNSKPDPDSDLKMQQETEARQKKAKETSSVPHPSVVSQPVNEQPQGIPAKNVVNYRLLNGPNEQPQPAGNQKVVNYRNLNGPNEQPEPLPGK